MSLDRQELLRLAAALALGLVIGAERERRKGRGPGRKPAGIRTFVLVALLGGVAARLGAPALVTFALAVVVFGAAAYLVAGREDPGLTTEIALALTYALGAYAQTEPMLAIGVAVVATTVLAFRTRLHGFVHDLLTTREMLDALVFAVCALVILPVLPDRSVGPLGVLNPFVLWRLVVLVMGITGAGYVAQRFVGPRFGLAVAGFASGFVSSSATIHAMGARTRQHPELERTAVAGAVASSVATFVQLAVLVGAASPPLLRALAAPLAAGGGVALLYAAIVVLRAARTAPPEERRGRAFRLRTGIAFAALVTAVMFVTRLVQLRFGAAGTTLASAIAGLADAHAASASAASLHAGAAVDARGAMLAVLAALSANTLTKIVLALTSGTRRYALRVTAGLAAMIAATWAAWLA